MTATALGPQAYADRNPVFSGAVALAAAGLGLVFVWTWGGLGRGAAGGMIGLSLAFTGLVIATRLAMLRARAATSHLRMLELVAGDPAAWIATNLTGRVILRNKVAEDRFGADAGSILAALSRHALDPAGLCLGLQKLAAVDGSSCQDLSTRDGSLRITTQTAGAEHFLWRIESFPNGATGRLDRTVRDTVSAPVSGSEASDLDAVPVPLMVFGPDGVLLKANRMARELDLLGEGETAVFHDLFDGLGRPVSDWLSDVVNGRHPGGTEVLHARRVENDRFMQVTLHRHDDGGKTGAIAVINDATRLKSLEEQVAQSQKMQAIGQLAGGIAHDFNNLLTAISGHCDLLFLRHGREDADFEDLEQIRQNANRAAALVGQLLAFSRKQTLQPELVDLEDLLSDLTHLLNRLIGERVGLRLSHAGPGPLRGLRPIRADRRQLEQVVVNLVINARDAMPEGGEIVIETEALTLAEDLKRERAVVPAGDYSVIRVIDQGTGISPENCKKIFEPFFTTKRVGEGTGLGLSMAYGIVKQSGGYIFVDSTLGQGSTFTLYFPAHDRKDKAEAPPTPRRKSTRHGAGVVLLVEDEAPVRAFAGRALRLRGYTVLEAGNAEEALKTLEDRSIDVDVFVTDVMMPGMDGPTWVRQALQSRPHVRVVFVSGYSEDILNNDNGGIPNAVFLPKPFSLNDLTSTVHSQFQ